MCDAPDPPATLSFLFNFRLVERPRGAPGNNEASAGGKRKISVLNLTDLLSTRKLRSSTEPACTHPGGRPPRGCLRRLQQVQELLLGRRRLGRALTYHPLPTSEATQSGKATDPVSCSPLNHIISWLPSAFQGS